MKVTKIKASKITKEVKEEIKSQFPTITELKKKHVSGVGYVYYVKSNGVTIGKVFKEGSEMVIYNDKVA